MMFSLKSKLLTAVLSGAAALTALPATQARADTNPFIGEIMMVGFNFCPRTWALADGQLLPISSNTALFSLYGTMYGGDGRATFAVPDLRGRSPVHVGNGPGLSPITNGQRGGADRFTLTSPNQLPAHNHNINATDAIADKRGPGSDFLAKSSQEDDPLYHDGPANKVMDPGVVSNTGASQPVPHRSPFLGLQYCVSLQGVFPSRN